MINEFIIGILGINSEDIKMAYEACKKALETVFLKDKVSKLEDIILTEFSSPDDLTYDIIEALFSATDYFITQEYPTLMPTYSVKDKSFDLCDNGVFKTLSESGIDSKTIKKIVESELTDEVSAEDLGYIFKTKGLSAINDLIEAHDCNSSFFTYSSVEELGADHEDHGCREEDDTDEMFGLFLIQAYKDGHGDICIPLENGSILVAV